MVAPPPPEDVPPPKPETKPEQKQPDVDVRKELIANIDTTPPKVPDISVEQNKVKEMRLNTLTKLGGSDADTGAVVGRDRAGVTDTGGTGGLSTGTGKDTTGTETGEPPPPVVKKVVPKMISGGVLNGKAISLPKPPYPPAARAVRASGAVSVQVVIDENGHVISASAASGHPLLRAAAEQAARGARFSPTLLSGQAVKVSGIITYNFVP